MGWTDRFLSERGRVLYERSFVSFTPILTPYSAGKAMMVNPKTLVAHVVMFLTNTQHPDDCECEVCTYRRDDSALRKVYAQQQLLKEQMPRTHYALSKFYGEIDCRDLDQMYIGSDEAAYWCQWVEDHFPEAVKGSGWQQLHAKLDDCYVGYVPDVILAQIEPHIDCISVAASEPSEWWSAWSDARDSDTQIRLLLSLSEQ